MSYTRRFSKTITVYYSGSVSYPASQNGGSVSYSGSKTENIVFNVHVDTDPFDSEVGDMKNHVDLLTGSVVATEAAHVKVIGDTSRKIGDTIISGFFKTVKSDISQQITELRTRSEALLLQLHKLAEQCNNKKRQMGEDYRRIAERYGKIFADLNNELKSRIYSIDEPVFHTVRTLDTVGSISGNNDMISTVSISSGENARLHSKLSANIAKRQAVNAIEKGAKYLEVQYETDRIIDQSLLSGRESGMLQTPYCVMETTNEDGTISQNVFASPLLQYISPDTLADRVNSKMDGHLSENDVRAISEYFNASVAEELGGATDSHARRVAEVTSKLFDLSQTATIGKLI